MIARGEGGWEEVEEGKGVINGDGKDWLSVVNTRCSMQMMCY